MKRDAAHPDRGFRPGFNRAETLRGVRYAADVPAAAAGGEPGPLVVALHWGGPSMPGTGEAMLRGLIIPGLGGLDAVFAAPDRRGDRWDTQESEADVLGLIDELCGLCAIDMARIAVTGYSLGGIGSWHLAGRNPRLFAAALPVSAAPPGAADLRRWTVPLHVIHGREDEIFPFAETERAVGLLRARGFDAELSVVEGAGHFDMGGFVGALKDAVPWIRGALRLP